jgi:hypothetical protein
MWKNIFFGRSGGYYLFYTSVVYLVVGMYNVFVDHFAPVEVIQVAWVVAMVVPFAIPPVGRYFNMNITWDQKLFKKKKTDMTDSELPENVVQFPEPKLVPSMPKVEPPKPEKPTTTFYRLGLTDNNRVSLSMGYSEITMTTIGINNMIAQLEVFRDQLYDETEENGDE